MAISDLLNSLIIIDIPPCPYDPRTLPVCPWAVVGIIVRIAILSLLVSIIRHPPDA